MRSCAGLLAAYGKGDVKSFNRHLADYRSYLNSLNLPETKTFDFEGKREKKGK